mgnify:CR=1 FL=1
MTTTLPEPESGKHEPGLYWHVHHDVLAEWCWDYQERAEYVRTQKPQGEQELRLRLLQPVQGQLATKWGQAWAEWNRASAVADKARAELHRAEVELGRAEAEHRLELEALHTQECPNCPWDGRTIFPQPFGPLMVSGSRTT